MVRLLDKDQLEALTSYHASEMEEGLLYLEFRHPPELELSGPIASNRFVVALKGYSTVIPLQEKHLKALMDNLYTCRFIVKNDKADRLSLRQREIFCFQPLVSKVPDGTYEFYYGKGLSVGWGGITTPLPADHPLYSADPRNIQTVIQCRYRYEYPRRTQREKSALFS